MNSINIRYWDSPVGRMLLGSRADQLCLCLWQEYGKFSGLEQRIRKGLKAGYTEHESPVLIASINQLEEYFDGKRSSFSIPLFTVGTDFQQLVWTAILTIPYGQSISYSGLARKIGCENTVRAVAAANGANAISIFIPCHRVIGNKGALTGYSGGIPVKKALLALENHQNFPKQGELFHEQSQQKFGVGQGMDLLELPKQ